MKNYKLLPNGKVAIKRRSLLDWFICTFIPNTIGYYEIVRIGRETDWAIFWFVNPNRS
jgi:hypothetical protein